jgi:2',3'-cyclic-nucleotide 2'-phosphodiesterase (5'-nucleotidase family)
MLSKQHAISISVCIIFSALILVSPAFSQDTPAHFTLQLLHAADLESGVEALENAPRFSAVLNALKAEEENTVIIGAGDTYIPGAFFAAGNDQSLRDVLGREGSGRADILMLNAMGFMASALGNHEFDLGTSAIAGLIQADGIGYVGTAFPFLSANLDFSLDRNLAPLVVDAGQEASTIPNSLSKSAVITTPSGEKIGVVGATTPWLRTISSPGDVGIVPENREDIPTLAAIIQESVDELKTAGVKVIILTGHLQRISIDEALAPLLHGVDIIISGGSNTLLADNTDRLRDGDTAAGVYPFLTTSAAEEPVAIVSTDGDYKYVGRLVLDFDEAGVLIPDSIDPEVSGVFATDEVGVTDTGKVDPAPQVVAITEAVRNVVITKDGKIFGSTSVYLEGRRGAVRAEETNLGNLTADANLDAARRVDPTVVASLKNGAASAPPSASPWVWVNYHRPGTRSSAKPKAKSRSSTSKIRSGSTTV